MYFISSYHRKLTFAKIARCEHYQWILLSVQIFYVLQWAAECKTCKYLFLDIWEKKQLELKCEEWRAHLEAITLDMQTALPSNFYSDALEHIKKYHKHTKKKILFHNWKYSITINKIRGSLITYSAAELAK